MSSVADAIVSAFNEWWKPGSAVILVEDGGAQTPTLTRSAAWTLGSKPVVLVEGRIGGYDLTRIVPVPLTPDELERPTP